MCALSSLVFGASCRAIITCKSDRELKLRILLLLDGPPYSQWVFITLHKWFRTCTAAVDRGHLVPSAAPSTFCLVFASACIIHIIPPPSSPLQLHTHTLQEGNLSVLLIHQDSSTSSSSFSSLARVSLCLESLVWYHHRRRCCSHWSWQTPPPPHLYRKSSSSSSSSYLFPFVHRRRRRQIVLAGHSLDYCSWLCFPNGNQNSELELYPANTRRAVIRFKFYRTLAVASFKSIKYCQPKSV